MKTVGVTVYGVPDDKNRATKIQIVGNVKDKDGNQVQNIQIIQSKVIKIPDGCVLILEELVPPKQEEGSV